MLCYFAAPLFSAAERSFNAALTARLEELGVRVFLPQRDGAERDREPYTSMAPEEWRRAVFELDRDMVLRCDLVLCVLDGRTPDEGGASSSAWRTRTSGPGGRGRGSSGS